MLRAEAAWLRAQLARVPDRELSPLLSVGSGAGELQATQPWIQRDVYGPLERRGIRVLHHELRPGLGVDVAGDLTDPAFLEHIGELEVSSVLCSNVLEHLPNPADVASALERAVAPGGHAFVTVPRRYPFHPGPIDTLFRPTPEELGRLFPGLEVETAAEIRCESLVRYLLSSSTPWTSLRRGLSTRQPAPTRPPLRETVRMAFVSTAVSAVVLRSPVLASAP